MYKATRKNVDVSSWQRNKQGKGKKSANKMEKKKIIIIKRVNEEWYLQSKFYDLCVMFQGSGGHEISLLPIAECCSTNHWAKKYS